MVDKVYIVVDFMKIPVMACEDYLIYLRKVRESEVNHLREVHDRVREKLCINVANRMANLSPAYSRSNIHKDLFSLEAGEFSGLYLERDLDLPNYCCTYTNLPKSWRYVADPSKVIIGDTSIEEIVRNHWWRRIPGYKK